MAINASSHSRRLLASAFLLAALACSQNAPSSSGGGTTGGGGSTAVKPTVAITEPTGAVSTESGYTLTFKASAASTDVNATIASFTWDFGDGSATVTVAATTDPNGTTTHAFAGTAGVDKSFSVTVRAVDSKGTQSDPATATVTIPANAGPKASIASPVGLLKLAPGESYTFRAQVDPATVLPGTTVKAFVWSFGDGTPNQTVLTTTATDGAAIHAFASATADGAYYDVKVAALSSLDNTGVASSPAQVDVKAAYTNQTPVITVTTPSTSSTGAFTSKPVDLVFTLQDGNGDAVTYTVDWGDGTAKTIATVSNTQAGATVPLKHTYADTFTSATKAAAVTVDATDSRSVNGQALQRTRTFDVSFNALPAASILSPQASGTLPAQSAVQDGGQGIPVIPAGSSDPEVVVVPSNGKLIFNGTGAPPSSGGNLTYQWTFNGGSPSVSTAQNPGEIFFPGVAGQIVAYLVDLSVKDDLGRTSALTPRKPHQKWVIVDGKNTQDFILTFKYLKKSDNNAPASSSTVRSTANGLGAAIQIFQDGIVNAYKVEDASGTLASLTLPVRSDLPFYIQIPSFGGDANTYLMRIPNKPGLDPTLEASSSFTFGATGGTGPWNPQLTLATGQGFADETAAADQRNFVGTVLLGGAPAPPANVRWVDRLSVPGTDPLGATNQWVQVSNSVGGYNPIRGYQSFAEWLVALRTLETADPAPSGTKPSSQDDLRFVLDFPADTGGNAPTTPDPKSNPPSKSYKADGLDAFRVPKSVTDPYLVDASGASGTRTVALTPTLVDGGVRSFMNTMVNAAPGSAPLAGGIGSFTVPYNANDANRVPDQSISYGYAGYRTTLAYSEYLWSKVWARPLVLNRTNLGWYDMAFVGLSNYDFFRYSNPAASWPSLANIQGDNAKSAINFNVTSGGTFDPTGSPAVDSAADTPSPNAIGRFFWTAYVPIYGASQGSVISRTWLADPATKQLPTTFPAATSADPTPALGFIPPQDPVVDKRGRKADGSLDGTSSGGYRVLWYNPTRSASSAVVPPDFWVVVLETTTGKQHFLLPGNYPAGTQSVQDPILTDARTSLATTDAAKWPAAAPGYCWFDIPSELRPAVGTSATLTVFAIKSIKANNAPAIARALNRPDWIEAIKLVTAGVKVNMSASVDLAFAHKIPFNFPWDIVVANSVRNPIAP